MLPQVPPGLQKKIRSYYEYLWESGQDRHSTALFDEMPEKLKLQLNIALKKRLIEKVTFVYCTLHGGSTSFDAQRSIVLSSMR